MRHVPRGPGEAAPTPQPIEHLAALRAIPNMRLFRPADAIETAECWQLALERTDGPTVLALTRQNLAAVRKDAGPNRCAEGAYELVAADGAAEVTLFATGSEVEIAVAAQALLKQRGIAARVVSVPSLELFLAQGEEKRRAVIRAAKLQGAGEGGRRPGR